MDKRQGCIVGLWQEQEAGIYYLNQDVCTCVRVYMYTCMHQ